MAEDQSKSETLEEVQARLVEGAYRGAPPDDEESFPIHSAQGWPGGEDSIERAKRERQEANAARRKLGLPLHVDIAPELGAARPGDARFNRRPIRERQAEQARRIDDLMDQPEIGMTTRELLALSERYLVLAQRSVNESLDDVEPSAEFIEQIGLSRALSALAAARVAFYGSSYIMGGNH